MLEAEQKQKDLYDSIAPSYFEHYSDKYSVLYRNRFQMSYLFRNIDLDQKLIFDAMCGSGQVTEYLKNKGCKIEALDISKSQIEIYKNRFPNIPVNQGSILATGYPDNYFDIVVIKGGLHHIHPLVKKAVKEVYRILKPEGYFLFSEPHSHSVADKIRKFWYSRDPLFADNEASIDFERLENDFLNEFKPIYKIRGGNIAYHVVLNSMVFRIPIRIKRIISPPLLFIERLFLPFQVKFFSAFTIVQWMKNQ